MAFGANVSMSNITGAVTDDMSLVNHTSVTDGYNTSLTMAGVTEHPVTDDNATVTSYNTSRSLVDLILRTTSFADWQTSVVEEETSTWTSTAPPVPSHLLTDYSTANSTPHPRETSTFHGLGTVFHDAGSGDQGQSKGIGDMKEVIYVTVVIGFYSAALLALICLQVRRYYTRSSNYVSFGDHAPREGYDLYEEYAENRQLINTSRRARMSTYENSGNRATSVDRSAGVDNINCVKDGFAIDLIPEHVV